MAEVFLEIVFDAKDCSAVGIDSRDEVEDPLEEALDDSEIAEVTGGGGGMGTYNIDVEVVDERHLDKALKIIRRVLRKLKVPANTRINRYEPKKLVYDVYE